MKHRAIFGLTLLAACAPGAAMAQDCKPLTLLASVEMIPNADHTRELVPVTINGEDKKLILDTGGYTSQISRDIANDMKLSQKPGVGLQDVNGNRRAKVVTLQSLQIGRLRAENIEISVTPDLDFTKLAGADGLLSPDLLQAYDIEMDFGADRLNYFSADHCEGKVIYWEAPAVAIVPFSYIDGHYILPVTIDGKEIQAEVDTGAATSVMTRRAASYNFAIASGGFLATGEAEHQFESLAFEGIMVRKPKLALIGTVGDLYGSDYPLGPKVQALIGMDVLSKLRIFVAFRERKLYITPAQRPAGKQAPAPTAADPVPAK